MLQTPIASPVRSSLHVVVVKLVSDTPKPIVQEYVQTLPSRLPFEQDTLPSTGGLMARPQEIAKDTQFT